LNRLTSFLLNAGLASLDGLLLYVYDRNDHKNMSLRNEALHSFADMRLKHHDGYWTVENSEGIHGYGALLYLIAMQICGAIASDNDATTSLAAQDLWNKFYNDPRIEHTMIPDRDIPTWLEESANYNDDDSYIEATQYAYSLKQPIIPQSDIDDAIDRMKKRVLR